jgi:hypothetical protein
MDNIIETCVSITHSDHSLIHRIFKSVLNIVNMRINTLVLEYKSLNYPNLEYNKIDDF